MKPDRLILAIAIFGIAGYAFYTAYSSKKDIEALQLKLAQYNSNPPQRNTRSWIDWIQVAVNWASANRSTLDQLWKAGGAFFNRQNAPSPGDVDFLIQNGDVNYSDYV